jgi:hypothetical protein
MLLHLVLEHFLLHSVHYLQSHNKGPSQRNSKEKVQAPPANEKEQRKTNEEKTQL